MGRPENKRGTEKQPQQVDLAKVSLKEEPLCVGVDEEELPRWTGGMLARDVVPWRL